MGPIYKLNGKNVSKEIIDSVPEAAMKAEEKTHVIYFETPEYTKNQAENSRKFFEKLNDNREELEKRHG